MLFLCLELLIGRSCFLQHVFSPQVLYCYGKHLCQIPRDAAYYSYQNKYHYCEKCFAEFESDRINIGDENGIMQEISKTQFEKLKNDHLEPEP